MKTKQVNYAYPHSDIAERYNMPNGGWTVETGKGGYMPWPKEIISAHLTEKEAITAAHNIDLPWCKLWLNCKQNEYNQSKL